MQCFKLLSNARGLDWNYFIAPFIDHDLHEKLLEVTQEEISQIVSVLTEILSLIRSGYFYTAKLQILQVDVSYSSKLTEIKTWLVQVLTDADDTQE